MTVSGVLVDASVARSFAVIGWTDYLPQACGGAILLADGVHGLHPEDPASFAASGSASSARLTRPPLARA
jgi:hypothetical protein